MIDIEKKNINRDKFKHIETMECYIRMLDLINAEKEDYTFDYTKICSCGSNTE